MLASKKLFLLFVFLLFSLIFVEGADAGCCVFYQIAQEKTEEECAQTGVGVYFDNSCSEIEDTDKGCCCLEGGDYALAYDLWCSAVNSVDFGLNINTDYECEEYCSQTPLCEYSNCREPNDEICQCGSILTTGAEKYCYGSESQVFSTKEQCMGSMGRVMVFGYIRDNAGNYLKGINVKSGSEHSMTDEDGYYYMFLTQNQEHTLNAYALGCDDSETVDISDTPERVDFILTGCEASPCDYECDWENNVEYDVDVDGNCIKSTVCTSSSPGKCPDITKRRSCCPDGICDANLVINGEIYNECYACPMDCEPNECSCDPDSPRIEPIVRQEAGSNITIRWNFNDNCYLFNSFDIKMNKNDEGGWKVLETNVPISVTEYEYEFTEENTDYCFKITAYLDNNKIRESEPLCMNSSDMMCWKPTPNSFCLEENKVYTCNTENQLELVDECESGVCVGPDSYGASYCVDSTVCDDCNGIFGMFAYTGMIISELEINDAGGALKDVLYNIKCEALTSPLSGYPAMCVYDYTTTTTDKYQPCSSIFSCYDYNSNENCVNNPCSLNSECTWSYTIDEFGQGICSPEDAELQDCSLCDETGNCNEEKCSSYGECYYTVNGECVHRNDAYCSLYRNKGDCIGLGVTEKEFSLDKETNEVIETSGDYFGFGKCQWLDSDNECIKNSDDDIINTPDDCRDGSEECLRDVTSPNTSLKLRTPAIYYMEEDFDLRYSVIDDTYPEDEINTYFCVVKKGEEPCYPDIRNNPEELLDYVNSEYRSPGEYIIYYYSQDPSENLEEVKGAEIIFKSRFYPSIIWADFI
ncbi:hypothetical protein JW949_01150 [Candidatus Woesearchaeota archaeon]|nr:hypothetical protein [Candidatus Woesearchaeota archaeon]